MTEEKKLDEKTLEEVSGGITYGEAMAYNDFLTKNCYHCTQANCPYGDKYSAFHALGGAICTKREAK